jgi:hypothetical protein
MPGITRIQWWSRMIGESSRPTSAVTKMASMACPARNGEHGVPGAKFRMLTARGSEYSQY